MHVILPDKAGFDWMWIWWLGTVILCLWKMIEAVVFRPVKLLEWPFIACTMWLYFFGYMAYKAKLTLGAYLGNGMSNLGQLMAFLCLVGLLAGWAAGMRVPLKSATRDGEYPFFLCWLAGMFFIGLGAIGNYSVSQAVDEGDMNFHTASAYWYLLFYVGYPGLAIAIWSALKSNSPLKWVLLGLTLAGCAAFMWPQVVAARRGPLFPAIIVLLTVPPLTLRRPPNRLLYCGSLVAAGIAMLLFLQVRMTIYSGGTWSEAFRKLDVSDAVVERGEAADDNEYVNSCQVIGTIFESGKYQYGTGYVGLLFHWVPRSVWPAKPALGEGSYNTNTEIFDDVEKVSGIRVIVSGAAIAGPADSFIEFGVLCPFFWFFLGFVIAVIYLKAVRSRSPWWLFSYAGVLCSTHWLISQSFAAAFVPGMYFQLVPVGVLVMVAVYRRLTAPPQRTRLRRVHPPAAAALPS